MVPASGRIQSGGFRRPRANARGIGRVVQLIDESEDVSRHADTSWQMSDLLGEEIEAQQAGGATGKDEAGRDELELRRLAHLFDDHLERPIHAETHQNVRADRQLPQKARRYPGWSASTSSISRAPSAFRTWTRRFRGAEQSQRRRFSGVADCHTDCSQRPGRLAPGRGRSEPEA